MLNSHNSKFLILWYSDISAHVTIIFQYWITTDYNLTDWRDPTKDIKIRYFKLKLKFLHQTMKEFG